MDGFDADVLIYAASAGHPLGERIAALFDQRLLADDGPVGCGSTLLIPEMLTKPLRDGLDDEVDALVFYLAHLDLRPVDETTADLAVILGGRYRLKPIDAVHLASAVGVGAARFITNNRRDFAQSEITEIAVTYPEQLDSASSESMGDGLSSAAATTTPLFRRDGAPNTR